MKTTGRAFLGVWTAAILLIVPGSTLAQRAPQFPPLAPVEKLFYRAVALHAAGHYSRACDTMREAARLAPGNAAYREYLAELQFLSDQAAIDRFALETGSGVEDSVDQLGKHLSGAGTTDRARARAIYRWITARISYDFEGLAKNRIDAIDAAGVLKHRKTICEGYANTFEKLAKAAGLEAVVIRGYAKGPEFTPGESFRKRAISHAWNAVKIDGSWQLLDSTWGAGGNQDGHFKRHFNDYYFLTPSAQLAFSHFPTDSRWQLVDGEPIGEGSFGSWARIDHRLFRIGLKASAARRKMEGDPTFAWMEAFDHPGTRVMLLQAPFNRHLISGKKYHVRLKVRGFPDMAIINGNRPWRPLPCKDGQFDAVFTPQTGSLAVAGRLIHRDNRYFPILQYVVD